MFRFLWLLPKTESFEFRRMQMSYMRSMTKKQGNKMKFFREQINSGTLK